MVVTLYKACTVLAQQTGLSVATADVRELAERGLLTSVMPGAAMMVELDGFTAIEVLRRVVEARRAWMAASIDRWDAAAELGVTVQAFEERAARHGVKPGRFGRYGRSDIARLRRGT